MTNDTFSRDTNRLIRSFVRAAGQIREESDQQTIQYVISFVKRHTSDSDNDNDHH